MYISCIIQIFIKEFHIFIPSIQNGVQNFPQFSVTLTSGIIRTQYKWNTPNVRAVHDILLMSKTRSIIVYPESICICFWTTHINSLFFMRYKYRRSIGGLMGWYWMVPNFGYTFVCRQFKITKTSGFEIKSEYFIVCFSCCCF